MRKIVAIGPSGNVIENSSQDESENHNDLLEESFYDFASMLSDDEKAFHCEIKVWPIAFWVSKLLHHIVVLENHIEDDGSFVIIAPLEVDDIQKEMLKQMYHKKDETYCLIQQVAENDFAVQNETYENIEEIIAILNESRKRGR